MGKGTQSMVLAVGRQGIIFIPVIYIMSHLLNLNLKGIIISQALTDILTAIFAYLTEYKDFYNKRLCFK